MKVKRFFAADMSAAMRLVREEVGADAVILSTNNVAGGVEVVIALDHEDVSVTRAVPSGDRFANRPAGRSLVGMKKPERQPVDRARREQIEKRSQEVRAMVSDSRSRLSDPASRAGQLQLDDAVWDDVLASLNKKQAQKRQTEYAAHREYEAGNELPQSQTRHDPLFADSRPSASQLRRAVVRQENPPQELQRQRPERQQSLRQEPVLQGMPSMSEFDARMQSDAEALRAMRAELDELKGMLRGRLQKRKTSANAVAENRHPVQSRIAKRLQRMGLGEQLVERLVDAMESDLPVDKAWKSVLARLSESLPVVGENIAERGGVIAFVGATGVGKTTTIGKIAAQYVLKHGSSGVALVTTDSYRIAAHDQLKTFGRILDVPVRTVDEENSLDDILHRLRDKRLILIDTAGLSMLATHRKEQLDMLSNSSYRLKKFLVMPATAQFSILKAGYDNYQSLGLNGAVLTKVDESVSLGEVLSLVVEKRLPVAYLTDGQKVPDDIEVARSSSVVSRAVVMTEEQARAERQSKAEAERASQNADLDYMDAEYTDQSRAG